MDNTSKCMVSSTAASITVTWDKQFVEETIDSTKINSYDIKYRVQGTGPFSVVKIQKKDSEIEIKDLKSSTEYEINVLWCNEKDESKILFTKTCKTEDSKATFLMERASSDKTRKPYIYYLEPVSEIEDLIEIKQDTSYYADRIRVLDMIAKHFPSIHSSDEKTVLLLGGTGTGKSTFVDGLINFIAEVSFTDDHRFGLICKTSEELKRADKQFESQTSSVTVYRIPRMQGLKISCGVNIIDTPGFNDTREDFDKRITAQIKELFQRRINHVDAILIVLPLSAKRLTQGQKHIFSSILDMFGDDVRDNIFVILTHDDSGDEHSCLSLLDEADIPYKGYFRFNNSNIFSNFVSLKGNETINQAIWNTRNENFSNLFKQLEKTRKTTIASSIAVMRARSMLEIQLKALEYVLSVQAQYIANYKEDMLVVQAIELERPEIRRKAMYSRTVAEIIEKYNRRESLNCPTCRKTCHQKCWVPMNKLGWTCEVMKNDKCTVCNGKCDAKDHVLSCSVFKVQFVTKLYSGEQVLARQKEREETFNLLQTTLQLLEELITEITRIALSKNALTVNQYIQNLVNKEKRKEKEGYEKRTQIHENILKHFKKKAIMKLSMDYLMEEIA